MKTESCLGQRTTGLVTLNEESTPEFLSFQLDGRRDLLAEIGALGKVKHLLCLGRAGRNVPVEHQLEL